MQIDCRSLPYHDPVADSTSVGQEGVLRRQKRSDGKVRMTREDTQELIRGTEMVVKSAKNEKSEKASTDYPRDGKKESKRVEPI